MNVEIPFILLFYYISVVTSSYCYWNSGCPYKYFSSKTAYSTVRGDIRDSIIKLKGCEPISIWGLIKHGKTNPGGDFAKEIEEAVRIKNYIVSSYDNGTSSLCAQDIENLREWTIDKKMLQEPNFLTEEGYQEMVGIGSRFKRAFSKLLAHLEDGRYAFRPGFEDSLKESAKGFIKGLQNEHLKIEQVKNDDIVAPYTTCDKYRRDVKDNSNIINELTKYQSTSDYLAAKDRMQRRLGIGYPLSNENIETLYNLCRYIWSGINNKFSPWCALFTTEDLKVHEYTGDLEQYYWNGYGAPINELLGRIPIADLFKKFQEAKDGKGNKITAYFTHSAIINMASTVLNLYTDKSPLTGAHRDPKRKWRTSKLSAFSANLVAVMNRCTQEGKDDYNVIFYLNEEPMGSICEHGVCSWQEFEYKLKAFSNTTRDFCEL